VPPEPAWFDVGFDTADIHLNLGKCRLIVLVLGQFEQFGRIAQHLRNSFEVIGYRCELRTLLTKRLGARLIAPDIRVFEFFRNLGQANFLPIEVKDTPLRRCFAVANLRCWPLPGSFPLRFRFCWLGGAAILCGLHVFHNQLRGPPVAKLVNVEPVDQPEHRPVKSVRKLRLVENNGLGQAMAIRVTDAEFQMCILEHPMIDNFQHILEQWLREPLPPWPPTT